MALKKAFIIVILFSLPIHVYAEDEYRLSDTVTPVLTHELPERPSPIIELGPKLLDTGKIGKGIKIPGGAVWNPSFMLWGTYRGAVQTYDDSDRRLAEVAQRFDLFGNLYLTPTERVFMSVRPLDKGGRFTRYTIEDSTRPPNEEGDFEDELNFNVRTLFFEGDIGELFPFLDSKDFGSLDYSFSVGRQPILFQDGLLIDDNIDSLGISKINIRAGDLVNLRTSVLWGWDEINRNGRPRDDRAASLFGIFNEADTRFSTIEFDAIYVESDPETGDGVYTGLGATQRFWGVNSTFRVLNSSAVGDETEENSSGTLLFSELSISPYSESDFIYLNSYIAFENYRSASRDPSFGGPLGAVGVSFEPVRLGRFRPALESDANDSYGGALGYQTFFREGRTQLILEFAGRSTSERTGQRAIALSSSLRTAIGRRVVIRIDAYGNYGEYRSIPNDEKSELGYGARFEWVLRL